MVMSMIEHDNKVFIGTVLSIKEHMYIYFTVISKNKSNKDSIKHKFKPPKEDEVTYYYYIVIKYVQ